MRLLICGDRNWTNYQLILKTLRTIHETTPVECVIEGEQRGADLLGRQAAEELNITVLPFPANWTKYGRAAGPIRNQQMLNEGRPNSVVAFHSDLMSSKGTKSMVELSMKAGINVIVVK
jgi:hypothetical protein